MSYVPERKKPKKLTPLHLHVIEITVWKPPHIQINWCALDFQHRAADNVHFLRSNRQSFKGVVVLFTFSTQALRSFTRAEGVRKLSDGENTLPVVLLSIFRHHAGQKAQVIFSHSTLTAEAPKLTLSAVAVQNEVG